MGEEAEDLDRKAKRWAAINELRRQVRIGDDLLAKIHNDKLELDKKAEGIRERRKVLTDALEELETR